MNCHNCGAALDPTIRFCRQCGVGVGGTASTSFGDQGRPSLSGAGQAQPTKRKWSTGKILLTVFGVLLVIAAGLGVAAFFGVRYAVRSIKDSEVNKVAMAAVKEDRAAREALGEITEFGFPLGSFSTDAGGAGKSSLSMSVTGTKAGGTYYSTLERTDGVWRVTSGRVELPDGRSIDIGARGAAATPAPGGAKGSGGRQLDGGASVDDGDWREVEWKDQGVSARVPANWQTKTTSRREFEMRGPGNSYFGVRTYVFDQQLPEESLLMAALMGASEKLRNGLIEGYSAKEIGGVVGVLNTYPQGDRFMVTWSGFKQRDGKNISVDVVLSVLGKDRKSLGPVLSRVLDSIRFD